MVVASFKVQKSANSLLTRDNTPTLRNLNYTSGTFLANDSFSSVESARMKINTR